MDLSRPIPPEPYSVLPPVPAFSLTSDDVAEGITMPGPYTARGGSTSPQLGWRGFPEGTRGFVVSCFDPDAPTPAGFWHWTLVNLPAHTTSLPSGAGSSDGARLPRGSFQALNDGGTIGYQGAAPPNGDRAHRYVFAVHALDVDHLDLDASASPTKVAFTALFHTIGRATLAPVFQA